MSAISHDNPQLSPSRTMNHFLALQNQTIPRVCVIPYHSIQYTTILALQNHIVCHTSEYYTSIVHKRVTQRTILLDATIVCVGSSANYNWDPPCAHMRMMRRSSMSRKFKYVEWF